MATKQEDTELEPVGPDVDDESTDSLPPEDDESAEKKEAADDDEAGHEENSAKDDDDEESNEDEKSAKKKTRKQRQREARDRDRREMQYLRIRNEQLEQSVGSIENRTIRNEAVALDQRIQHVQSQLKLADEVIAEAVTKGAGRDMLEAQQIQRDLQSSLNRLVHARGQVQQTLETREADPTPARSSIPPEVIALGRAWVAEHSWYKPQDPNHPDSARVKRIDAQLTREGFDPTSEEYWDELSSRVEKALPHRFKDSDEDDEDEDLPPAKKNGKSNGKHRGGPIFTTQGREVSLKPGQVFISPARKAAMVEAGVWDDPKERQRYLKQYAKYDREHGSQA